MGSERKGRETMDKLLYFDPPGTVRFIEIRPVTPEISVSKRTPVFPFDQTMK